MVHNLSIGRFMYISSISLADVDITHCVYKVQREGRTSGGKTESLLHPFSIIFIGFLIIAENKKSVWYLHVLLAT